MRTSESLNEFAPAFIAFQGEMQNVKKDSANPFFKSKYAKLENIIEECRPLLLKHGLAVIQSPSFAEGRIVTTTRVIHKSAQWIEGDFSLKPVKEDPQSCGSAVTFGRRYSLAILGIATEDDDDGNAASGNKPKNHEEPASPPPTPKFSFANAKHLAWLQDAFVNYEKKHNVKISNDVKVPIQEEFDGKDFDAFGEIVKKHVKG